MNATPIPGTGMVITDCAGACGARVVAIPERADTAHCSGCLRDIIAADRAQAHLTAAATPYTPPTTITYPPADYPPSTEAPATTIRLSDPHVAGYCLSDLHRGRPGANLHLMSLDPADIDLAHKVHNAARHTPWLIGGPGGGDGDICNPCGGCSADSKTPLQPGPDGKPGFPRHDLCLRGRARGRGRDCPCTHGPHMRGTKPGTAVDRVRAHRATTEPIDTVPPPVVAKPAPIVNYLFDPEDFDTEGDTDA